MKKKLLLGILLSTTVYTFAQDRNWSVDVNYPINLNGSGVLNGIDGTIDVGLKYRFLHTDIVHLGLAVSGGFTSDSPGPNNSDTFKSRTYFFQPKIFAEFDLPIVSKLHPNVGLGYSVVSFNYSGSIGTTDFSNRGNTDGGLNFEAGLSYDITSRFFVQAQYDLIRLQVKDEVVFDGERVNFDFDESISRLKVGVGFRF
mgnify:FL=1